MAIATIVGLAVTACQSSRSGSPEGPAVLPAGAGSLPTGAVVWAVDDAIHVDDRVIEVGKRVRAMVHANGRIYFVQGRSDAVRATDGGPPVATGLQADELRVSEDGRYLGALETSTLPWSTVIVDLESGRVVVRDDAGMGGAGDDFADLYEDAEPHVLGFADGELYVRTTLGNAIMSWDPNTGQRTEHGDPFFFARPDPGGGRELPALVRHDRLVMPRDPYRSTQRGHVSPDGSVALMPVDGGTRVYDVKSGRRLATAFPGRKFLLGAWTSAQTAYGIAFDGSPFGPRPVRLVSCRLSVEKRQCQVLRTVRAPAHELVLFPTGSAARDY